MTKIEMENRFLDYIDGVLPEKERLELETALSSDSELQETFKAYQAVVETEKFLASKQFTAPLDFETKVMSRLEDNWMVLFRRFFMEMAAKQKIIYGSVATLATVLIVAKLGTQTHFTDTAFRGDESFVPKPASGNAQHQVQQAPVEARKPPLKTMRELEEMSDRKAESAPPQPIIQLENEKPATIYKEDLDSKDSSAGARRLGRAEPLVTTDSLLGTPIGQKSKPAAVTGMKEGALAFGGGEGLSVPYRPIDQSSESYKNYAENERMDVRQQPSSTFSIDVDTASYTNARRFLKDGLPPPADSIRTEEFINYFNYSYPVQYEKPFSLSYEIAPSPLEPDRQLLKLGIKSKDLKESDKPWNLVFLIDISGSMMDSNKLPLVQKSLKLLVDRMKEKDKLGIVTYAGSAGVALESTGFKDKTKILSAIDGLSAGGSTYGSGGINAAYELAQKNKIEDGVNRVVLATDGDFNVGITSHEELIKLIEEKRKSGVTLTTLGYGRGNIKDDTMEQLANKGNGNYFYIDSFQEARKVLETDLNANMEVVAKDVKLQVEFNPAKVSYYRLVGYENRKLNREDFNNDTIDAGEIGAGHTVTAIYEVVLKDSPLNAKLNDSLRYQEEKKDIKAPADTHTNELAFVKIRYKDPNGSESKLVEYPIEQSQIKSLEQTSSDFKFAAAVAYFGQMLRGSKFVGTYTYEDVYKLAESGKGEDKNGYRQEFIELVKNAAALKR